MRKEIAALRALMEERGIDVYIVPTCDFHGSEYINEYFSTRKFLSGFTGSAGTLVITKDDAKLWTDGRYFLQAGIQLDGSGIKLMKSGDPGVSTIEEYLDGILGSEKTLAFDGRVVSYETGEAYGKIGGTQKDIYSSGERMVAGNSARTGENRLRSRNAR